LRVQPKCTNVGCSCTRVSVSFGIYLPEFSDSLNAVLQFILTNFGVWVSYCGEC